MLLTEGLIIDRRFADVAWVSAAAAAARASLYAIVLDDTFGDMDSSLSRNSPSTGDDRQLRHEGIQALVGLARGAAFEVIAGATGAFDRLSRELTGYYLLAFEPDASERDGKAHEINVKVKRRGIEIRARREFTVDPRATARPTDADALGEAIRDPLLATERRMQVATYSFPDPGSSKVRVLIATGLGMGTDDLPIKAVAYRVVDEDGKLASSWLDEAPKRTEGDHRYLATVVLAPGTYSPQGRGHRRGGQAGHGRAPLHRRLDRCRGVHRRRPHAVRRRGDVWRTAPEHPAGDSSGGADVVLRAAGQGSRAARGRGGARGGRG